MVVDLLRALAAALAVGVVPGWFWSRALCVTSDTTERLTFSVGLSLALVPAVALIPATMFGVGVTPAVAIVSPAVIFTGGVVVYLLAGNAKG